jgi:anti-anti-sigma factor
MPTLLTLDTTRRDDGKLVLIAEGEIDLSNVGTFTQALTTAIAETAGGAGTVTVDLSAVEYLDSAAINALFTHAEHIRLIVRPLLIRIFEITGLTELTSVETAPPQANH